MSKNDHKCLKQKDRYYYLQIDLLCIYLEYQKGFNESL